MVSATQHFISKLVNLIFYTTSKLVNGFIEAAKRYALIKQTKDIYCPCCDCRNRIVCRDPNTIRSHLVRRGFKENYEIWDHHGETYGCRQQGSYRSTRRGLFFDPDSEYATDPKFESLRGMRTSLRFIFRAEAQLMLMNSL